MKKIKVITDQCIGCGACIGIDNEHFDYNDDGYSHVISNDNLDTEALQDAIESCPVQIISIEEDNCDNPDCNCNPCTCEECHCHECNED